MLRKLLVTGSSGLIGSEVVTFFCGQAWQVDGLDNNMRREFFGSQGDTSWNKRRLQEKFADFCHHEIDIRDRAKVLDVVRDIKPDAIVHAAAQPSHDLAAGRPQGPEVKTLLGFPPADRTISAEISLGARVELANVPTL
jgi:CDP-paratose 2-epimerase